ncbi:hypothetical protein P3G55_23295 [Leptospira sp. 96542]|nr:hypothetical protein [Leptospira sp. 96542]
MFTDSNTIKIINKNKEKALEILINKYPEYEKYRKYLRISSIYPNEIIQIALAMELSIISGHNFVTIWSHEVSKRHFRDLTMQKLPVITLIYKEIDIPHSINIERYIEKENLYEYKDPDWKKYGVDRNGQPMSLHIKEDLLVKKNYGNPLTVYTSYIPSIFQEIENIVQQFDHYRIVIE